MFKGKVALVFAVWAVSTGVLCLQAQPKILWMLGGQDAGLGLCVSADGTRLASCSVFGSIKLWSLPDGKLLRTFNGHGGQLGALAISPDGTKIASADAQSQVILWDAKTGAILKRWVGQQQLQAMTFSPDGMMLATGGLDADVKVWSVPDAALVQTFGGHIQVTSLSFTSDGKALISGDYGIREWDVATGVLRKTISPENYVSAATLSPSGNTFFALVETNIVRYSLPDWNPLPALASPGWMYPKLAVSSDGAYLARTIPEHGGRIRVWDARSGEPIQVIENVPKGGEYFTDLTFAHGGRTIFSGYLGIQEWDVATGSLVRELTTFVNGVGVPVFSPNGEMVALADPYRLKLFRASDGVLLGVLPENFYTAARFSSDGQFLTTQSQSGDVQVWRVSDQSPYAGSMPPDNPIEAGRVDSPDGSFYATTHNVEGIRLWRQADGIIVRTIAAEVPITSCAFSPDGSMIAGSVRDLSNRPSTTGEIRVWRVRDGAPLCTFTNETTRINFIAWSKKNVLAFGRQDAVAVAVDMSGVRAGPRLDVFRAGEGSVLRLTVTGAAEKTLRIEKTTDFSNRTEWTNVVATGAEQAFDYPMSLGSAEFFQVIEE